jgi:nucleotide-binding universal stress UspA family protein
VKEVQKYFMDKSIEDVSRIATILVPLKGHVGDDEVVRQAALVAKRNKARVILLHVIVVKQQLALDAPMNDEMQVAENMLQHGLEIANSYGVTAETSILQARSAGLAIVEEVLERKADTLMLAITYYDRFRESNWGQTIPYILRNAPCRVWIYREEIKQPDNAQAPNA